jgi:PRC-barrel domain
MPAFDVVRRWKGRVVVDRDGHRIGSVVDIYYDAETDEPGWALLDLEQADGKTSLVPLAEASELSVGIQVPFEVATVRRAPGMPLAGRLWPQDEAALYRYYGLDYTGASLVDLDELEEGEGNWTVEPLGDTVKVGLSPRWLLSADDPELS